VGDVLALAVAHNARVHAVTPRRETLEDLFVRNAIGAPRVGALTPENAIERPFSPGGELGYRAG
jgi:hypothetical protein